MTQTKQFNPRDTGDGRAVHDLGGLSIGPIDRDEHELTFYEKRVDALLMLLAGPKRGIFRVDALRRVVEEYAQSDYDGLGYYDRWIGAISTLLVEQEVLSAEEIDARCAEIRKRLDADGQRVARGAKAP